MSVSSYEATRGRVRRVVVHDPLYGAVYSRPARKGGRLVEDAGLQSLLLEEGEEALRRYALQCYYGFVEAVVV